MNIAVLGYYGFGNAGDEVILQNLVRFLAPHRVFPLSLGLNYSSDTFRRLNRYDFLVVGGGGLINTEPPSPFANFHLWAKDLERPFGLLGIGVGSLSDQFRRPVDRLLDEAAFCLVRDEDSRRILDHPKVRVAPDLTFYRPFPFIEQPRPLATDRRARCGVNLRPKHPAVAAWVETLQALPFEMVPIPFSSHPALGDREILGSLAPGRLDDFQPRAYEDLDFLVATAFHAVVFAVQMGVPVIAINYDPKVARLMAEIGLTDFLLEWEEYARLPDSIMRLIDRREEVRRRMRTYTEEARGRLCEALDAPRRQIDAFEEAGAERFWTTIPGQPLVSILVDARQADPGDLNLTVRAALDQQYDEVEVLILTGSEAEGTGLAPLPKDPRLHTMIVSADLRQGLEAGLTRSRGTYVTWVQPGAKFEADALPLTVQKLHARPEATAAVSGYFISEQGIIQRKVRLHRATDRLTPLFFGPAFLVRRAHARDFLAQRLKDPAARPNPARTVYLEITLFHQPGSNREKNLYRGLLAFSRGEIPAGRGYLANAFQQGRGDDYQEADLIELTASIARNATVSRTPLDFVRMIEGELPPTAAPLRPLLKKVRAHITMTQFFETHAIRPWHELARTAWRGIQLDPTWLRNKGIWSILGRSLLAGIRPRKTRAVQQG